MPERPSELIYALDETPPWPHLLALGFQHVAVICPYLVMVALVAEAAKLPHHAAQSTVGLAMIAVAFMTVLQSLRLGPVGSGYLCPPVVSAIYLPSSLAAASSFRDCKPCVLTWLDRDLPTDFHDAVFRKLEEIAEVHGISLHGGKEGLLPFR
jgi:xanthine/uracil permease